MRCEEIVEFTDGSGGFTQCNNRASWIVRLKREGYAAWTMRVCTHCLNKIDKKLIVKKVRIR